MRTLAIAIFFLSLPLAAQTPEVGVVASVPFFGNATCPIMAKPASAELFFDTSGGRIYICCAPCIRKIMKDPEGALKAAYPKAEVVENTVCPVSGKPIPKDAPTVTLQGKKFSLCCDQCVDLARKKIQVTLARLEKPSRSEVGNRICPVTDKAVNPELIVLVGDEIVHVATVEALKGVVDDPASMLEKARRNAAEKPKDSK